MPRHDEIPCDDAWHVQHDADDAAAALLEREPAWTGYALADLEPPYRQFTTVALARRRSDPPAAACVVLRHPEFTAMVPYGDPAGLAAILGAIALPARTSLAIRAEHWQALDRHYVLPAVPREMRRMTVTATTFTPPRGSENAATVERLCLSDAATLRALYSGYPDNAFFLDQLRSGIFYGVRSAGGLLAAGGTHVLSARYGVAAIGNIFTRPAVRGRGYATAVTATITTALLAQGCGTVILNVAALNRPAIRVYERLGFREHCRFWEVDGVQRERRDDCGDEAGT